MSTSIQYTKLRVDQVTSLSDIDRSELVDGIYRAVDGRLQLETASTDVGRWHERELHEYVTRLTTLLDGGGVAFGAWDGGSLAGFGSLDTRGVGGRSNVLKLDMLYVSKDYRGRGIGRGLTALLMEEARSRGASALYVSATPSRKTVDAYLAMGAEPLKAADPELFRREPEDVHLIMRLPAPQLAR